MRSEFLELRKKLYEAVGELGTQAELLDGTELDETYAHASHMLDYFDEFCLQNGYFDGFERVE